MTEPRARLLNDREVAELLERGIKSAQVTAMLQCTRLVCGWCDGRLYPDDKSVHSVQGPNEAGNYIHVMKDGRSYLCDASSIHSAIRALGEESMSHNMDAAEECDHEWVTSEETGRTYCLKCPADGDG